jgi:hypothetical protein
MFGAGVLFVTEGERSAVQPDDADLLAAPAVEALDHRNAIRQQVPCQRSKEPTTRQP